MEDIKFPQCKYDNVGFYECAQIILTKGNQSVLVGYHKKSGAYAFIGGKCKLKEKPMVTATRELFEECEGITQSDVLLEPLGHMYYGDTADEFGNFGNFKTYLYIGHLLSDVEPVLCPGEYTAQRWTSSSDILLDTTIATFSKHCYLYYTDVVRRTNLTVDDTRVKDLVNLFTVEGLDDELGYISQCMQSKYNEIADMGLNWTFSKKQSYALTLLDEIDGLRRELYHHIAAYHMRKELEHEAI